MSGYQCQRVGHGGASALAPANTLASFEAAREVGVDMVEFDVRAWQGELVLAHTILHARRGGNVRLCDALAHLSSKRFGGIELNVDVKHRGCEPALLEGLRHAGLLERTLISSQVPGVLDAVKTLEPRARVGISIGGRLARPGSRGPGHPPLGGGHGPAPAGGRAAAVAGGRAARLALRMDGQRAARDRAPPGVRRARDHHRGPAPLHLAAS
jgi:hypothetical protein